MHELALAREVLRIAEEAAGEPARLAAVHLRVGALGCASPEALRFALEAGRPGLRVHLEIEAGAAFCADCAGVVPLALRGEPCPRCGGFALRVCTGEALRVTGVEVLEDEDGRG